MSSRNENVLAGITGVFLLAVWAMVPRPVFWMFAGIVVVALLCTALVGWFTWRQRASDYWGDWIFAKADLNDTKNKLRRVTAENARLRRSTGEPVPDPDPALVVVWPADELLPHEWDWLEKAISLGIFGAQKEELHAAVMAAATRIKADTYLHLRGYLLDDGLVLDVAREAAVRAYAGDEFYALMDPTDRLMLNVRIQVALMAAFAAALPERPTSVTANAGA